MSAEKERGDKKTDKKRIAEERKIHSGKVQGNPQQSIHSRKFQSEGQKNDSEEREDSTAESPGRSAAIHSHRKQNKRKRV